MGDIKSQNLITLEGVMCMLLNHACSNPSELHEGWNEYMIDLHCVRCIVIARHNAPKGLMPNRNQWQIRGWRMEDL